ncbi:MAG: ferrochelatase, partial [Proteobacteria bacterium]|nr:ferrochelatase [Pseudomonadota bacterium]
IGTPDDPSVPAVRRYLREFLSDPKVLSIPTVFRWLLLRLVILPFRSPKSAHAYQKVWTDRGSPLMFYSQDLADKVQKLLPTDTVRVAMRYGSRSIEDAFREIESLGITEIIGVPLFPQFSDAATGSAIEELKRLVQKYEVKVPVRVTQDFFAHPGFIDAQLAILKDSIKSFGPDHILASYHGLPENHVQATDLTGKHCLKKPDCCAALCEANQLCYRAQAFATTRALAKGLNIKDEFYTISFQSRLGRTPWIQPFTDVIIKDLHARGIKRLLVVCPSFVSDCLETIEEIGIRCREDWIALGGEDLYLTPCVNASDSFARSLLTMVDTAKGLSD